MNNNNNNPQPATDKAQHKQHQEEPGDMRDSF